jgi:hypothetical protein
MLNNRFWRFDVASIILLIVAGNTHAAYEAILTGADFDFMAPTPGWIAPAGASGLGTDVFTFSAGTLSVKQIFGLIPQNIVAGTPFAIGELQLVNNPIEGTGPAVTPPFDIGLDISLDLSTLVDDIDVDNVIMTFTETANVRPPVGAPRNGCIGANCPDTVRINVPRTSEKMVVPISATESLELTVTILGLIEINAGDDGYNLDDVFYQLAAGEGSQERAVILATLAATTKDTTGNGDPHFRTWVGEAFDFHGECDLMFLHNPNFANGVGMDIHVRTKRHRQWSYIDQIAVRIGAETIEIQGGEENLFWINGQADVELPNTIGGYQVTYKRVNSKQREFQIHLDHDQVIYIKTYKAFIAINVHKAQEVDFGSSVGLSGNYRTGAKLARDGKTILQDPIAFGQEWQIQSAIDGQLFRNLEGPQHPAEQCRLPSLVESQDRRRRLGESQAKHHDAEVACSHVKDDPISFDNCVFDVLLTDDMEMAGAY